MFSGLLYLLFKYRNCIKKREKYAKLIRGEGCIPRGSALNLTRKILLDVNPAGWGQRLINTLCVFMLSLSSRAAVTPAKVQPYGLLLSTWHAPALNPRSL
jgi:hypothetical protein